MEEKGYDMAVVVIVLIVAVIVCFFRRPDIFRGAPPLS
jgi:hypothetical protein